MTTVLTDLMTEVNDYPHTFLDIEIVEVDPASGTRINAGEIVQFRFQVTNRGPLPVRQLSLLIEGVNGTLVSQGNGAGSGLGPSYVVPGDYFGDVPAHQPNNPTLSSGSPYWFQPTRTLPAGSELVRISVAGWDTTLDHILNSHSRADEEAAGTYSDRVFPR